jgi:hypothetical protein
MTDIQIFNFSDYEYNVDAAKISAKELVQLYSPGQIIVVGVGKLLCFDNKNDNKNDINDSSSAMIIDFELEQKKDDNDNDNDNNNDNDNDNDNAIEVDVIEINYYKYYDDNNNYFTDEQINCLQEEANNLLKVSNKCYYLLNGNKLCCLHCLPSINNIDMTKIQSNKRPKKQKTEHVIIYNKINELLDNTNKQTIIDYKQVEEKLTTYDVIAIMKYIKKLSMSNDNIGKLKMIISDNMLLLLPKKAKYDNAYEKGLLFSDKKIIFINVRLQLDIDDGFLISTNPPIEDNLLYFSNESDSNFCKELSEYFLNFVKYNKNYDNDSFKKYYINNCLKKYIVL